MLIVKPQIETVVRLVAHTFGQQSMEAAVQPKLELYSWVGSHRPIDGARHKTIKIPTQ